MLLFSQKQLHLRLFKIADLYLQLQLSSPKSDQELQSSFPLVMVDVLILFTSVSYDPMFSKKAMP